MRLFSFAVIVSVALLAGLGSFIAVRGMSLTASSSSPSGPNIVDNPLTPQVNEQGTPIPGANLPGNAKPVEIAPSENPWDGAGRVTILLLGLDERDWGSGIDYYRSDTMILLTLDPLTKSAGILSIPRDMWVQIPGFQHGKINTAYYLGQAHKLPGGGPALAVKTVEQFLGVPINYYAQIDFPAFVKFIDELDGVKVNVPEKITIDLLGSGSKTKKTLQPGVQVLPGEWALAYARARHTEGGDFDRAARQQQVIMGIRNKILSLNMLPTLIAKAPALYGELSSGIHTNLSLDEVIKLALLAQQVPDENIKRGVFGQDYTVFGWSPDKLSILIPIPDKIHLLRDQIFATSSGLSPETTGDSKQQMQAEAARVGIYNGSGVADVGDRTVNYLRGLGVNVAEVGEADKAYAATTIVDHSGKPYAVKYLTEQLQVVPARIYSAYDPTSKVDVEVFLGTDWARNKNLP